MRRPRVEELHRCVRVVALERFGSWRQEEGIVLSPNREQRPLVRAEILLEGGIKRDVALVVAQEIQLNFISAGSAQIMSSSAWPSGETD